MFFAHILIILATFAYKTLLIMKHLRQLIVPFMAIAAMIPASAQRFFDTSAPDRLVTLGARIGVNSSNATVNDDVFDLWNKNSWGTGFDLGIVADINIRNFVAIQPGIFFQSRSGDFTYASRYWVPTDDGNGGLKNMAQDMVQYGHNRNYNIYVPILASFKFNIGSKVRWSADFGPYFNFLLKSSGHGHIYSVQYDGIDKTPTLHGIEAERRSFDAGIKIGTGFTFLRHYYLGVHYMGGTTDVWKTKTMGGRNKAWTFTAGYDF